MRSVIDLDPSRVAGRVDPKIYGHFLSRRRWVVESALFDPEHPDADATGVRRQVRDAIAATAPPVIRWPGGCTGTSYDWQAGIGPRADRPRTVDAHFGYDVDNGFGTAEFVAFCREIGAEPQLNLATGIGTLREALDWIEYTNGTGPSRWAELRRKHGIPDPLNVRYWQIGNEEWGDWEIGHCSGHDYALRAREWAKAIKKFDPELQVLAVGGWRPRDLLDWNSEVLRQAWPHIDYLTAHTYWKFVPGDDSYDRLAATGYLEEQRIAALSGLIDLVAHERGSTRRPKLAFTEWNAVDKSHNEMSPGWRPGATQYRLVDALACASFLNAMQRRCDVVTLANFAQSINVVGALVVTPDHVIRESVYWALQLQRAHSGAVAVPADVDCDGYNLVLEDGRQETVPYLDVSATRDEAGSRLWLSVVNRHRQDEATVRLRLRDATPKGQARMYRLWNEDPLRKNTVEDPDAVSPEESVVPVGHDGEISLPPHSYSILEFELT